MCLFIEIERKETGSNHFSKVLLFFLSSFHLFAPTRDSLSRPARETRFSLVLHRAARNCARTAAADEPHRAASGVGVMRFETPRSAKTRKGVSRTVRTVKNTSRRDHSHPMCISEEHKVSMFVIPEPTRRDKRMQDARKIILSKLLQYIVSLYGAAALSLETFRVTKKKNLQFRFVFLPSLLTLCFFRGFSISRNFEKIVGNTKNLRKLFSMFFRKCL